MATSGIVWKTPPAKLGQRLDQYKSELTRGVQSTVQRFAPRLAQTAKTIAPWNDRTGDARAGLTATAETSGTQAKITLATTVHYGVYLELGTRKMSAYPSVMPAIQREAPALMSELQSQLR